MPPAASTQDGFLTEDPREQPEPWQAALRPLLGDLTDGRPEGSHLAQLLNVAYAQHELTGWSAGAALAWLEARGRASIQELLQQEEQEQE